MFGKKSEYNNEEALEKAIAEVLEEMEQFNSNSAEYAKMTDQLEKLYKLRPIKKAERVSVESLLAIGGNLAGIVAILGFERAHIVSSKALGLVLKSKV